MKKISVPLSVNGLKELKEKIIQLDNSLINACNQITKELADIADKEIRQNYSASPYTDGNDDCEQFKEQTSNGYIVGVKGTQVLYREFGTGTEGLNQPHPIKNQFPLNEYNSGKTIREVKITASPSSGLLLGEKYWTYKNKQGEVVYTQGIPAGKEVFNAALALKRKRKEVVEKKVGAELSKL